MIVNSLQSHATNNYRIYRVCLLKTNYQKTKLLEIEAQYGNQPNYQQDKKIIRALPYS